MPRHREGDTETYPEYLYLAQNVVLRRAGLGLDQKGLAERMGVDQSWISGIENARVNATLEMLSKLAWALGTTMANLLTPIGQAAPSSEEEGQ